MSRWPDDEDEGEDRVGDGDEDPDPGEARDPGDDAGAGENAGAGEDVGRNRDGADDEAGRLLDRLVGLLELIAEMEAEGERRREGHADVGRTSVDYSVNIGTLDDLTGGDRGPPDGSDPSERPGEGAAGDDAVHVDVRETAEGATVVADLPSGDEEAVDVTLDDGADRLRIEVAGEPVGAVPLDGEELTVTDATVTNRVLEVRLERTDHDT